LKIWKGYEQIDVGNSELRGVGFGLMESRFFVEAKSFRFSVKQGLPSFGWRKRGKGFQALLFSG
jgi:hypothetical protein